MTFVTVLSYIERQLGTKVQEPTLNDITFEWAATMLMKDLKRLRLDATVPCTCDVALETLTNKYGGKVADKLYTYQQRRQTKSRSQLEEAGFYGKQTIRRNERMIANAGVSISWTESQQPLPALRIERG